MKISGIIKIVKDERGQALIEFALIFTMLVILLFGIAEFGRGWYYANALSDGARAGARYASMQPKTSTARQNVRDYTFGVMTSGGIKRVDLLFNMSGYRAKSGNGYVVTNNFSNLTTGDAVMVVVGYNMTAVTGHIVPSFKSNNTKTIVRKATMRYEGN